MNKIKNFLVSIFVIIGCAMIAWLFLSFCNWSFNPVVWGTFSRFCFIAFILFVIITEAK